MESLRYLIVLCIVLFELNYVLSKRNLSLNNLSQRIDMIDTNYHKKTRDLELEIRYLKGELEDEKMRNDVLEAKMNLSETAIKGSTVESNSKKLSYHSICSFEYYFFFNIIAVMNKKQIKLHTFFFFLANSRVRKYIVLIYIQCIRSTKRIIFAFHFHLFRVNMFSKSIFLRIYHSFERFTVDFRCDLKMVKFLGENL